MKSFQCEKCSYNTIRNYDLTRHLKRVHGISKKQVNSYESSNELQTKIPRAMSEDYGNPSYNISRLKMEAPDTREDSITEEEFRTIQSELRTSKCRILDRVVDTYPEHLKSKVTRICDILKTLDSFFVNRCHELIYNGEKLKGSNIHTLVKEILMCCPRENIQPTRTETKSTKLKTRHVPRVGTKESKSTKSKKSQNRTGITKFETLFHAESDSDESNSDESDGDGSGEDDDGTGEDE